MLIIGSFALKHYNIDIGRNPSDIDVLCTEGEFTDLVSRLLKNGCKVTEFGESKQSTFGYHLYIKYLTNEGKKVIVDASIVNQDERYTLGTDSNLYYNNYDPNFYVAELFAGAEIAVPSLVLMMKLSHRYKNDSVHFEKTMQDIILLRKEGVQLTEELRLIGESREKLTLAAQTKYNLNTTKAEFFTENVPYKYDHDDLHRAIAIGFEPAYISYLADDAQVMCSKEKFFKQFPVTRVNGVLEECYVLALERAVIPFGTDPEKAFQIALQKVCTGITSGWFREFAWENYRTIQFYHQYLSSNWGKNWWVKVYEDALKSGKIKLFERK